MGTKFLPKLKGEVRRAFGDIIARRIDQGNEGAFFSKFKDAYANKRKKFALGYKEGAYEDGFVIADDDMQAAAAAFVDRLVKVHIEDNEVLVSEVPCEPASMTNDAVFLLETFGKVWQVRRLHFCRMSPLSRRTALSMNALAFGDLADVPSFVSCCSVYARHSGSRLTVTATAVQRDQMQSRRAERRPQQVPGDVSRGGGNGRKLPYAVAGL